MSSTSFDKTMQAMQLFNEQATKYLTSGQSNCCLSEFEEQFDNDECIEIVTDFLSNVYLRDKLAYTLNRNKSWCNFNINQWISHENHPCPVITIDKNFNIINNYCKVNLDLDGIHFPFNFNLDTKGILIECKKGYMKFTRDIYEWLLSGSDMRHIDNKYKRYIGSINDILQKKNDKSLYFAIFTDVFSIQLMIQRSDVVRRYVAENEQIVVGNKVKVQIIEFQSNWDKYKFINKLTLYKLSYYISYLIINHVEFPRIIGHHHYYYKYKAEFMTDDKYAYYYLNYDPINKPLASVQKYYCSFDKKNILNQWKTASPKILNFQHQDEDIQNSQHQFWIGFICSRYQAIDELRQKQIYREVNKWIKYINDNNGEAPQGIHYEKIRNRWKFFLIYRYVYRLKYMTDKEMKKECKIAAGLRLIQKKIEVPKWIQDLINDLKQQKFIPSHVLINQIGINLYLNENKTKKRVTYSSINPHKENDKFSVVYSISIYSNPSRIIYISFNLKCNKSNGDVKIPLYHGHLYTMQSLVIHDDVIRLCL